jgi:acetoin utilization deacetylase AcuC-like enzyme
VLVAYDDAVTAHLAGVPHPERPDRVRVVAEELQRRGLLAPLGSAERVDPRIATAEELARVHPDAYVALVRRICSALEERQVAELPTGDTYVDPSSYEVAARAVGGALGALERVVDERRAGFALVRPPGHHAEPARGMGFCIFNTAAIVARTFAQENGGRVLVFDFDYHHGNGTQACIGGGVSYAGSHASPAYPGTGDPRDNRVALDDALVNVPIDSRTGIGAEGFIALHTHMLRALAARVRPDLLVVSAGYDIVAGDPVGDLGVEPSFARQMGRLTREIAETYCDGRVLFVLEGGYDPKSVAGCVAETIVGYEDGRPVDDADVAAIPTHPRTIVREVEAAARSGAIS